MRVRAALSILFLSLVAACGGDDATGPSGPDFTGTYTLLGSVNGFPTADIAGSVSITSQQGTAASVVQTLNLRESGQTFVTIFTVTPANATIASNGAISWTFAFEGDPITMTGTLSGNRIVGTWSAGIGGDAIGGSFTATK